MLNIFERFVCVCVYRKNIKTLCDVENQRRINSLRRTWPRHHDATLLLSCLYRSSLIFAMFFENKLLPVTFVSSFSSSWLTSKSLTSIPTKEKPPDANHLMDWGISCMRGFNNCSGYVNELMRTNYAFPFPRFFRSCSRTEWASCYYLSDRKKLGLFVYA